MSRIHRGGVACRGGTNYNKGKIEMSGKVVMPKFSANISMMFQEVPFIERFAAAARAGFKAVEFMFPYEYPVAELRHALSSNGLKLVLINAPAGNFAAGERGMAVDPARREEFRDGVLKAAEYAQALAVPQINCLVGKVLPDVPAAEQRRALVANLRFAAETFAKAGIRLLVEHLNSRDTPGFTLDTTAKVLDVLDEVDHSNTFLQYDVYHAQRMEGELAGILRAALPRVSHIQVADNPGRHQPGTGEINYRWLLADFISAGYQGYIGLEYIPTPDSAGSLGWVSEYGYSL
ncbi:MAG: TIM barrel protein [Candidatus Accumulibacter sp.]|jgi:hydroxypyruvate isomerase|nr:TIM barrel protein [Accumulibacter sp.]